MFFIHFKAVIKILITVAAISFLAAPFSVFIILLLRMSFIGFIAGVIITSMAVAFGAWLGSMWIGKNLKKINNIKVVIFWSVIIFLAARLLFMGAGHLLVAIVRENDIQTELSLIDVAIQSFVLYAVLQTTLNQTLDKKIKKMENE